MTDDHVAEVRAVRSTTGLLALRLRTLHDNAYEADASAQYLLDRARRALVDAERDLSSLEDQVGDRRQESETAS